MLRSNIERGGPRDMLLHVGPLRAQGRAPFFGMVILLTFFITRKGRGPRGAPRDMLLHVGPLRAQGPPSVGGHKSARKLRTFHLKNYESVGPQDPLRARGYP